MLVIPALDLRGGRCVRLFQGDPDQETVYGNDPVAVALGWQKAGAQLLHLVDLDGAFTGMSENAAVVAAIAAKLTIPLQLGGGVRSPEAVQSAFKAGIGRVIIGTIAIEQPALARELVKDYGEAIIVGIDARDGKVAVKGWTESSAFELVELAAEVQSWGVREIVYTDIQRDGTLGGQNLAGLEKLLRATDLQVIMSGGVSSLADLEALKPYADRVRGVIVGKALYAKQFTLEEALAVYGQ